MDISYQFRERFMANYICPRLLAASFGLNNGTGELESWINNGNQIDSTNSVPLSQWSHVALVYNGTNRTFYINGAVAGSGPAPAISHVNSGDGIGCTITGSAADSQSLFAGDIDALSVYNRALEADEIQAIYAAGGAGKCTDKLPPLIVTQPAYQTQPAGYTVLLAVSAVGGLPLAYQWQLNATNLMSNSRISGSQSSSLTISNAQSSDAGNYQVIVTNAYGSATSQVAQVTINPPQSVWDITNDFMNLNTYSNAVNPYGSWSYGYMQLDTNGLPTAGFTLGAKSEGPDGVGWPYGGIWKNTSGGTAFSIPPGGVSEDCDAGNSDCIRWTAPAAATYLITGGWGEGDGGFAKGIRSLFLNSAQIWMTNAVAASFTFTNVLAAGATVDFIIWGWTGNDGNTPVTGTISIAPPGGPVLSKVMYNGNGSVTLNCLTASNASSRVFATTNLVPPVVWQPIFTNTTGGVWQFTDAKTAGINARFYRLSTP
jgi:hypothetical protein